MRQREGEGWIGIVAVDPTSPFTGGALLGDRVRMSRLNLDSGVFIRSLATRGSMGGLATATEEVIDLMDGFGCNKVLIETIGVGQAEMDIVKSADTTLVVLVPGSGDSIQAMKAGLMEIGDIFVLNKSDREGAERAYTEIETALHFRPSDNWKVPIVRTVANRGEGIVELLTDIERHYNYLSESQRFDRQRDYRRREKILNLIAEKLNTLFWSEEKRARLDELTHQDIPISTAAEMLIENKKVRSNRD
jgi:LAO/AO transport system kinase